MFNSWSPFGWSSARRNKVTPFSPSQLTSLRGWWKSDTGITISTGVSAWADQSGNGNNLVQATAGSQPVVTASAINGLPAITFDGVDDSMAAAFTLAQPSTVFLLMSQITWTATDLVFDGVTALTMYMQQSGGASPRLSINAGVALGNVTTFALGSYGLMTAIFNGATSEMQLNSEVAITGNAGTGGAGAGGFTLGNRGTAGGFAGNVAVAEAIVMAAVATPTERAQVRAYMQARYGVGA